MALDPRVSAECRNAEADATARKVDNGYLRIYSGTKPANGDAAITGTLLAELRFSATSAPAASAGVLTFNALTQDSSADATGTPTHFRAFKSDGSSPCFDGTVGTSGCDLNISVSTIQQGSIIQMTSLTYTRPA